jgi:hypothetical protein
MNCDLVFRDLLHCVSWFSRLMPGAERPLARRRPILDEGNLQ